jgi:hypothetical protein
MSGMPELQEQIQAMAKSGFSRPKGEAHGWPPWKAEMQKTHGAVFCER